MSEPKTDIIPMFDLSSVQLTWERREKNSQMRPKGWESRWWECLVCGRPTRFDQPGNISVHMSGDGTLFPTATTHEEAEASPAGDMGCFPVGSSCARKIPAAYRTRLS